MSIEGYCSATSVYQGEEVGFHANSPEALEVEIAVRRLPSDRVLQTAFGTVETHAIPPDAHEQGCGWPAFYSIRIPEDWSSGIYRVDLRSRKEPPAEPATSDEAQAPNPLAGEGGALHFVVKGREPASPRLLALPVATYQAYNPWPSRQWPGKSLYLHDSPDRSRKVSFERPGAWVFLNLWGGSFVPWAEKEEMSVDYCTSIDLHRDPDLLSRYQLLLSVGHDEYWSKEMRDNVEGFISRGGNVAFFSGNTCWWQIRFEDDCRTIACYKNAIEDPLNGIDNERVTVQWYCAPVNRPENTMTGVSSRYGAYFAPQTSGCDQRREDAAYRVNFPEHWVLEDVKLDEDETFGRGEGIVGYESDGAQFIEVDGIPRATGRDGTPESFVILATADLTKWRSCGKGGYATMGIYRRNGTVFTAASVDWSAGFAHPDSAVHQITRNVISRLSRPTAPNEWEVAGTSENLTAMTAMEGKLFASSKDGEFLWREPSAQNMRWQKIGPTEDLVALGSTERLGGKLFAATRDGRLLWREPLVEHTEWQLIGEAGIDIVGMAGTHGKLFGVAAGGLWWRDPIVETAEWDRIDDAPRVMALAAIYGALYAVTEDGTLLWRAAAGPDTLAASEAGNLERIPATLVKAPWEKMGPAPEGVVALAASRGQLYAATRNGVLWWRDAS